MQVSTSTRPTEATVRRAHDLARLPNLRWVERRALDPMSPALTVHRDGLRIRVEGRNHRWHPGLLHTRREAGWTHPLVRAMDLRPGDQVLDCSLGLGIDAMFVGELTGRRVLAVEAIAAVALLTAEGLTSVGAPVQVVHAEATAFLSTLPDGCVDVVQGDPMFPPGTGTTPSLAVLRHVARHEPMGHEWLHQARRVARRRVVVRDIPRGTLLEELAAEQILGTRPGRARYGVWSAR